MLFGVKKIKLVDIYGNQLKMKNQLKNNWKLFLIASLTLGLSPFNPPHLLGKIQWILGGNAFNPENGMQLNDWFDVFLHGFP